MQQVDESPTEVTRRNPQKERKVSMCKGKRRRRKVDASVKAKNGDNNTGAKNKNTAEEIGVECTAPLQVRKEAVELEIELNHETADAKGRIIKEQLRSR
jgi:hypothetical protein